MIATKIVLAIFACAFVANPTAAFSVSNRVVDGETAVRGQFPYQASLRNAATDQHRCGGAIIRSNWILTVAHCLVQSFDEETQTITEIAPENISVVVGAVLIRGQGTTHAVSQLELHEDFNLENRRHNIGLLRLTEHIQFNRWMHPTVIGEAAYVPAGVVARVAGWGRIFTNGPMPEELQFLEVTTLSNDDCLARHADIPNGLYESTLCAVANQGQGLCHGDSGSPLVSDGELIGLASFALYCNHGRPDGFTRISSYKPWILEHIGEAPPTTRRSSTTTEASLW